MKVITANVTTAEKNDATMLFSFLYLCVVLHNLKYDDQEKWWVVMLDSDCESNN